MGYPTFYWRAQYWKKCVDPDNEINAVYWWAYPHTTHTHTHTPRRVEQHSEAILWAYTVLFCSTCRFDGLFNAFHIETVPTLLPYIEDYDPKSVLYSQVLMIHMANIFYPNQVIQFNPLGRTFIVAHIFKDSSFICYLIIDAIFFFLKLQKLMDYKIACQFNQQVHWT